MAATVLVPALMELTYKGARADVTQIIALVMRALKENSRGSGLEEPGQDAQSRRQLVTRTAGDPPPPEQPKGRTGQPEGRTR